MCCNFFGTQFNFQIMFNASVLSQVSFLKAYHVEFIFSRKLAFGKNREVEVVWVIWKSDQLCFLKVRHIVLNHLFLPLFLILSISSWIIYLDDL